MCVDSRMPPKRKRHTQAGGAKKRKLDVVRMVDGWPVLDDFKMYTVAATNAGWDKNDYKGDLAKLQLKDARYHLSHRAAGTRGVKNLVPPADEDFPLHKFNPGMNLKQFLSIWATDPHCRNILNKEMSAETRYVMSKPSEEHLNFNQKKLQWWSWTFMLSLEYVYPDVMIDCTGMNTCLKNILKHFLNDREWASSRQGFIDLLDNVLTSLNGIVQALWHDPTIAGFRPSAPEQFRQDLFALLLKSKEFSRFFGPDPKNIKTAHREYVVHGPFKHVAVAHARKVLATQERQRSALVEPRIVEEVDFKNGVRYLYKRAFGEDFADYLNVTIESTQQCAAILCILQLMCGSRCRGIVGVNWFDRLDDTFDEEYQLSRSGIAAQYDGFKHCVLVRRITKEKDQTTREWLAEQTKLKQKKLDPALENTGDVNTIAKHKTIVKPLLFMLLDRTYLNRRELDSDAAPIPEVDAVDAFMALVSKTRRYIKSHAEEKYPLVKWETSPLRYEMDGFSEEDTYELKNNQALANYWNKEMNKLVKAAFGKTFLKPGEGTHMLRRLYANRGYEFFGKRSMKETAFTQLTLGHKGFETSLRYTSIIFRPSLPAIREDETLETVTREKIADLEARLKLLEGQETRVVHSDMVPFVVDGGVVDVKKLERLARARHGERTSDDKHIERARLAAERLHAKGVDVTWQNLLKLGVFKNVAVRTAMRDYMSE